jgi:hypothetical protein
MADHRPDPTTQPQAPVPRLATTAEEHDLAEYLAEFEYDNYVNSLQAYTTAMGQLRGHHDVHAEAQRVAWRALDYRLAQTVRTYDYHIQTRPYLDLTQRVAVYNHITAQLQAPLPSLLLLDPPPAPPPPDSALLTGAIDTAQDEERFYQATIPDLASEQPVGHPPATASPTAPPLDQATAHQILAHRFTKGNWLSIAGKLRTRDKPGADIGTVATQVFGQYDTDVLHALGHEIHRYGQHPDTPATNNVNSIFKRMEPARRARVLQLIAHELNARPTRARMPPPMPVLDRLLIATRDSAVPVAPTVITAPPVPAPTILPADEEDDGDTQVPTMDDQPSTSGSTSASVYVSSSNRDKGKEKATDEELAQQQLEDATFSPPTR